MPRLSHALLLLALVAAPSRAADFEIKDGDRIVFYGDSITDQRLYTTFTESYIVTRFPKWKVDFIHSGWGGDRVSGGGGGPIDVRLKRDVLAYKPTVVTIMLGMNDASYRKFDEKIFNTYAQGLEKIVKDLRGEIPNLRITLIQPSPFDDVTRKPNFEGGYNAVLVRYGEFIKELARKLNTDVADLNTSVVEATKKADSTDHDNAIKLNPDRVHPGPGGQLLMAAALLKAWDAPAVVGEVEIDGEQAKLVRADKAAVEGLAEKDGVISWTQKDEALPMPVNLKDPVVALAMKSSDVMDTLNRQTLKVTSARAPEYTLEIDDREVGRFTREQLAQGVNLSQYSTPMMDQALGVHQLTLKHNNVHFLRWRQVQLPYQSESSVSKAIEGLDSLEAEIVQDQREAAQPKAHRYELIPVK